MPTTTDDPTTPPEPKPYGRVIPRAYVVRERAAEYRASPDPAPITFEDFLVMLEASEEPSEFIGGQVVAMGPTTLKHGLIVSNISDALSGALRGGPCRSLSQGMLVKASHADNAFLPDVLVFCGTAQLERYRGMELLLNPIVIFEVLSPSTAEYDHETKWESYRRIPTLQDYLMVWQDEPRVERYTRHEGGLWMYSETAGLDASVHLESIGTVLSLAGIYHDILPSSSSAGDVNG
jgi:Uma2 family endonuclease